ncbi:hypothetical protein ACO2J1_09255 [Leptospira interrogans]|uniref:Nucleotidyltransferase domain protein n=5 Tax=Leptospira interrogans TaxID=173 RepID=A0A0E2D1K6_LEPIR|nr:MULTISPECIES: hypothetical protein [Leptospira]EKO24927.1 hypothetical protein LEP1GSC104_0554 [Leptospira interrogans str. UI 12621]EKO70400.1 hypothetical protein LEP1GSC069_2041 [Leptospira interrogans serovar Canicola str. Fiocruz LV133]EKR29134.1 hypothetical protein LEP1GSC087_2474 [Leptospira interrogans serovar Bataviae str. L1111]EKR37953.1 hypothetical protein LEP1GSC096_2212 [Leptospira interrogans serovar Hebdomadis str. R499]EKR53869.1 hypothetical protein LEP1GSC105_0422 [Lept
MNKEGKMESIKQNLQTVFSLKPFEILFYGSRQRGDFKDSSDFNFFLLADPSDQLKSTFLREINAILSPLEEIAPVQLVTADIDSFLARLRVFEPSAAHLCELGEPFFGKTSFPLLTREWAKLKTQTIDSITGVKHLKKRYRFYKSISPRNTKEEILRMERLIALYLQSWVFKEIEDLSWIEIVYADVPTRLIAMIRGLYYKEADENILEILNLYEEVLKLKTEIRNHQNPFSAERFQNLKDTIRFEEKEIKILKLNY